MGGNRDGNGQASIGDLPWASVFDPAANARAFSAIQAEGFRAASRIVDRFIRASDSGEAAVHADFASAANDAPGDGLQEFERLARMWWSMVGQFLLRSMPLSAKAGSELVSLDVDDADSKGAVKLAAAVGDSASAEVWLHNRGPRDRADVRLHCSDLLSHEGDVIPAEAVLIDAAVVPMPRRSSRGVTITVGVAPQVRPGIYRGTLLASGHPDLWLPVVLTVRMPDT